MIRVAVLLLIAVTVNAAAPKCGVKSFNKLEGDRIVSGRDAIPME
jgi:hypothetical protein